MSLEDDLDGFVTVNSSSDEDAQMATASDSERGPMIIHAEEPASIEIIDEEDKPVARQPSKPSNDSDGESVEEVEQVPFSSRTISVVLSRSDRLVRDTFWRNPVQSALIVVNPAT